MSLILKKINNPLPGSDKSPPDIELQDMVLNSDKTAFIPKYKSLEVVKKVVLKRLEVKYKKSLDWYYPEISSEKEEQAKKFLKSKITFTEASSLNGETINEKAQDALVKLTNNDNRKLLDSIYKNQIDKINSLKDVQSCVDILEKQDIIQIFQNDEDCEDCKNIFNHIINVGNISNIFNSSFDLDCSIKLFDKCINFFKFEKTISIDKSSDSLGDKLVFVRPDLIRISSKNYNNKVLNSIGSVVHCLWTPIDRTNTLSSNFKTTGEPIPNSSGFKDTFSQVADSTAASLWDENKKIKVYWSGGIDSTVALIALLKTKPTDWQDRLEVIYTHNSIEENINFWINHIKDKIKCEKVVDPKLTDDKFHVQNPFNNAVLKHIKDNASEGLTVTGECGDQLFGSAAFVEDPKLLTMSIFDYLKKEHSNNIDEINMLNSKCPIELKTISDMLWWWNFNCKWQEVSFRSLALINNKEYLDNIRHFFKTDNFQKWSIENPDKKIKDTLESYKFTAKNYIYDYDKDDNYRDYKIKEGSLQVKYGSVLAIDNKNNIICAGDTSSSKELLIKKYGDSLLRFLN
tara:strand:+ start:6005 stop:7720 length:1716 start_codon:yes stop_codon:yes gene_type:complete